MILFNTLQLVVYEVDVLVNDAVIKKRFSMILSDRMNQ